MKKEHVDFYQRFSEYLPDEGDLAKIDGVVLAELFLFIDVVEKRCVTAKKQFRESLLSTAEQLGIKNKRGHFEFDSGTALVIDEKRQSNLPSMDDLIQLLQESGLDTLEAFDESKVLEMNPSKLDRLLETGRLDRDKFDSLRKEVHVLKVKPTGNTKDLLKTLTS